MKKIVLSALFALCAQLGFAQISSNPNGLLKFGVRYNPEFSYYEVYATPVKNIGTFTVNDVIGGAQVTLSVPVGFRIATSGANRILSETGTWNTSYRTVNSLTDVNYASYGLSRDFLVIGKNPIDGATVSWVKNQPVVLFTFKNTGGCGPVIRPIDNTIAQEATFITNAWASFLDAFDNSINLQNNPSSAVENYRSVAPYAASSCVTISGNVWNDFNGNGVKNGSEHFISGTNTGSATADAIGTQLYVNLADASGKVLFSSAVAADGTYSFANVPANMTGANALQLQLSPTRSVAEGIIPAQGIMDVNLTASNTLPSRWMNVSIATGAGNGATQGAVTSGIIRVNTPASGDLTNQNFGIEQTPVADNKFLQAPAGSFTKTPGFAAPGVAWPNPTIGGSSTQSILADNAGLSPAAAGGNVGGTTLSGSDPEDCATASSCTSNRKFKVVSVNNNTLLYYYQNGAITAVVAGTEISNLSPSNLRIYGQSAALQGTNAANAFGFTYSLIDAANQVSPASTFALITTGSVLPVKLASFEAASQDCKTALTWETSSEKNADRFELEHSANAKEWITIGSVKAIYPNGGRYSFVDKAPYSGANQYRLKMIDNGGSFSYSAIAASVNDCAVKEQVTVYPTDVTGEVFISLPKGSEQAQAMLLNDLGQVISTQATGVGTQLQSFQMSSLAAGHYLVRVVTANEVKTFKVVKR